MDDKSVAGMAGLVAIGSGIAVAYAIDRLDVNVLYVAPLLVTEVLAVLFLALFLRGMDKESIGFESRWAGLGGGLGGWKVTRPLVYLVCMLLFATAFAAVLERAVADARAAKAEASKPNPAAAVKQGDPAKKDGGKAEGAKAEDAKGAADAAKTPVAAKK